MGVENLWQAESVEQSEQQKLISTVLQDFKNNAFNSLTDNNLLTLFDEHLLELEVSLHNESSKTESLVNKFSELLSTFQSLQHLEWTGSWFSEFTATVLLFERHTRLELLTVIANYDVLELSTFFDENWFPTNKLEFELLSRKLSISIDNYPVNEHNEYKLHNVDGANIEKLLSVYNVIQPNVDQSEVFVLLKSLSEGNKDVYPKLKSLLLSQPEALEKLLNAVISSDKANNTTHYESLKYTLLTIDPAFESIISHYENKNQEKIDTLYKAHVYSLSWTKPKMNGRLFESMNDHGDTISIDITKKPPYRTLALAGSEYSLEANRDLGELHKPNLTYQKQKQTISSQLKAVNILQTTNIQEYIADLVNHEYQLPEVKRHLTLVYGVDINFISSLSELASPYNLESKQTKLEAQLKSIEKQYNQELSLAITNHRDKIFEQDEKTRDVLKFIADIGLDLLPKKYSDQIINEVKSWMIIVDGINLDPSKLDLKSWIFGESATESWTNQWKKNLIMFFNKMITGSTDLPIIKEMHLWISWKVEDRTVMRHLLVKNGVISSSGSFNIELLRVNLRKKEHV